MRLTITSCCFSSFTLVSLCSQFFSLRFFFRCFFFRCFFSSPSHFFHRSQIFVLHLIFGHRFCITKFILYSSIELSCCKMCLAGNKYCAPVSLFFQAYGFSKEQSKQITFRSVTGANTYTQTQWLLAKLFARRQDCRWSEVPHIYHKFRLRNRYCGVNIDG